MKPDVQRYITISIIAIGLITLLTVWLGMRQRDQLIARVLHEHATPAPDPLLAQLSPAERSLTIPYLRTLVYDSDLAIEEVLEDTARYTAYRASYLADGEKVYGLLAIPKGETPAGGWPAIILMHGYLNPNTYQTNGASYRAWWQAVVNTGEFAVFKPDLRGHGASEGSPHGAYFGSEYVSDGLSAYAALGKRADINASHIGFWGHSMSGNTLFRIFVTRPAIPAFAIWGGAVYTYQDLVDYGITDPSYHPDPRATPDPTPAGTAAARLLSRASLMDLETPFWRAMIPTNFVHDLPAETGAIAIFHAENDDVVSVQYAVGLDEILDETDVPHELYLYPTGGHNMTEPTFSRAFDQMIKFFREQFVRVDATRTEATSSSVISAITF